MKNALTFLPRPSLRPQVVASLRAVFDAPDRPEAERQLELAVKKYRTSAPKLAEWLEANVPEGLTVFALPAVHRRRLRRAGRPRRRGRPGGPQLRHHDRRAAGAVRLAGRAGRGPGRDGVDRRLLEADLQPPGGPLPRHAGQRPAHQAGPRAQD